MSKIKLLKVTKSGVVVFRLDAQTKFGTHSSRVYYSTDKKGFTFLGVMGIAGYVPAVAHCPIREVTSIEELIPYVAEVFGAEVQA